MAARCGFDGGGRSGGGRSTGHGGRCHGGRGGQGLHVLDGGGTATLDDADLAFGLGDFQFGNIRFGHQIDQCLEFAQIHGTPVPALPVFRKELDRKPSIFGVWRLTPACVFKF
ncbi:hypothetical protein D3C72_1562940 [compost metagenome]